MVDDISMKFHHSIGHLNPQAGYHHPPVTFCKGKVTDVTGKRLSKIFTTVIKEDQTKQDLP